MRLSLFRISYVLYCAKTAVPKKIPHDHLHPPGGLAGHPDDLDT